MGLVALNSLTELIMTGQVPDVFDECDLEHIFESGEGGGPCGNCTRAFIEGIKKGHIKVTKELMQVKCSPKAKANLIGAICLAAI